MKTEILIAIPCVLSLAAFVWVIYRVVSSSGPPSTLMIRIRDRAIFEASSPDDYTDEDMFRDMHTPGPHFYFRRLQWVENSFWPSGRLVRTGEIWEPKDESEFDTVASEYVIEGLKILNRRNEL